MQKGMPTLDTLWSLVPRFQCSIFPAARIDKDRDTPGAARALLIFARALRLDSRVVQLKLLRKVLPHDHSPCLRELEILLFLPGRRGVGHDYRKTKWICFKKGPGFIEQLLFPKLGSVGLVEEFFAIQCELLRRRADAKPGVVTAALATCAQNSPIPPNHSRMLRSRFLAPSPAEFAGTAFGEASV